MSQLILKIDATFGLKVKTGEQVKQGQPIGTDPATQETLYSPTDGTIEDIIFDPDEHVFNVTLKKASPPQA